MKIVCVQLQRANGCRSTISLTFFPSGKESWLIIDSADIIKPIEHADKRKSPISQFKTLIYDPHGCNALGVFHLTLHETLVADWMYSIISVFNVLQLRLS